VARVCSGWRVVCLGCHRAIAIKLSAILKRLGAFPCLKENACGSGQRSMGIAGSPSPPFGLSFAQAFAFRAIPARVVEKQREFGFRGALCAHKARELRSMYDTDKNVHAPLFSLRGFQSFEGVPSEFS